MPLPPKPMYCSGWPEMVGEHPVGEDALIDLAHLPGTGDHAAAVDHGSQPEGVAVLLDQQLGGELGGAVQRAGAGEREVLGDPGRRGAGHGCVGGELETGLGLHQRQRPQRGHGIDAAGREKHQVGALAAGQLQAVVGAEQVGLHHVLGRPSNPASAEGSAEHSTRASTSRAARGGHRACARRRGEASRRRPAGGAGSARAAAPEVVEGGDRPVGMARASPSATLAPMKPAPPVTSTRINACFLCAAVVGHTSGNEPACARSGSPGAAIIRVALAISASLPLGEQTRIRPTDGFATIA